MINRIETPQKFVFRIDFGAFYHLARLENKRLDPSKANKARETEKRKSL